jgi:hypothetical protein
MVMTGGRTRIHKRFWLLGVVGVSCLMWFAIINLGRTGHTKIIRSGQIIAQHAQDTAADARVKARQAVGAPPHEAQ